MCFKNIVINIVVNIHIFSRVRPTLSRVQQWTRRYLQRLAFLLYFPNCVYFKNFTFYIIYANSDNSCSVSLSKCHNNKCRNYNNSSRNNYNNNNTKLNWSRAICRFSNTLRHQYNNSFKHRFNSGGSFDGHILEHRMWHQNLTIVLKCFRWEM